MSRVDEQAGETERRRLAQGVDRKNATGVPFGGMGCHLAGRESARHLADGALLFREFEVHWRPLARRAWARRL